MTGLEATEFSGFHDDFIKTCYSGQVCMLRKKSQPEIALNLIKSSEKVAKAENFLVTLPIQLIA